MNPWWSIKCPVVLVSLWTLSAAHYRRRWRALNSCAFVRWESFPESRDPAWVWALNISPQGVIHSGRVTDGVSTARSSDCLSSNVKQRCHFQFNMQRSLKGMLIWAFINWTALPEFPRVCWVHPSSAGHPQVGARYGITSYPTSKLTDCCSMSRLSAYCWLNIY